MLSIAKTKLSLLDAYQKGVLNKIGDIVLLISTFPIWPLLLLVTTTRVSFTRNYTFSYKIKLFLRRLMLGLVKSKNKLRKFWGWEAEKWKTEIKIVCISFKNLLTKNWSEHCQIHLFLMQSDVPLRYMTFTPQP